jgi:hypothetical protein
VRVGQKAWEVRLAYGGGTARNLISSRVTTKGVMQKYFVPYFFTHGCSQ